MLPEKCQKTPPRNSENRLHRRTKAAASLTLIGCGGATNRMALFTASRFASVCRSIRFFLEVLRHHHRGRDRRGRGRRKVVRRPQVDKTALFSMKARAFVSFLCCFVCLLHFRRIARRKELPSGNLFVFFSSAPFSRVSASFRLKRGKPSHFSDSKKCRFLCEGRRK